MKNNSIKTVVATGIGAALFIIIGTLINIPTPIPNTNLQLQYAVVALFAVVYGPTVGFFSGFIGHALKDALQYGSPWWTWVLVSGLIGLSIGLVAKKIKIEKTSVILDELIDSVMTKFLNRHPEQKVTIDIPNEIVVVSVDPILIEQVLMNLLENAVFHAENMTHIILRVFASERKVIFEIADDGCGIREDMLKDIFGGTYGTQNNSADGKKRNAGIGLSVCATIIKAHDGEISAENRKDGGALFRFTLGKEDSAYDE